MAKMIEIIINGNVIAVVVEELAKLFVTTLVQQLPAEMSIQTRVYNSENHAEAQG